MAPFYKSIALWEASLIMLKQNVMNELISNEKTWARWVKTKVEISISHCFFCGLQAFYIALFHVNPIRNYYNYYCNKIRVVADL